MPDTERPWEEDDAFTDSLPYVNPPFTALQDELPVEELTT